MPNEIKKNDDGTLEVKLETGEVFAGDPLTITQKMADAHVSTKRWGQGFKQELDALKAQAPPQPAPVAPPVDTQEAQLQKYLLEQQARALGFQNAEEYRKKLERVVHTSEEVENQIIAANFLNACQDFPNTPDAIAALDKKIKESGWDYSPQAMIAAHAVLVREHQQDPTKGYAPLTQEQINSQWTNQMAAANRPPAPPPMISSRSPDATGAPQNEWSMPIDQLRARYTQEVLQGKR